MNCYILFYDSMAMFEIVLLSYIFNTKKLVKTVGLDHGLIITAEGIPVKPEYSIDEISLRKEDIFVIPGGEISNIKDYDTLRGTVTPAFQKGMVIAAICAGIDIAEKIVPLSGYKSVKNTDKLYICDRNLITARPEAYLDFAIETANAFNIFSDCNDYEETYSFFKYGSSPQS